MDMQFCGSSNFGPVFNFTHGQGPAMHYPDGQYPVYAGFPGLQYMYASQQPPSEYPPDRNSISDGKTESKPRLSKDEVERLEKIFQENPKPSSSVKAQLADELGLERPRINNWFQNRRAKAKQERKQEEYEARRAAEKTGSEPGSPADASSSVPSLYDQDSHQQMKPSSAPFPEFASVIKPEPSLDHDVECDEEQEDEAACNSEGFDSPFAPQSTGSHPDGASGEMQSPLSLNFSRSEDIAFSYSHANQAFSAPSSIQNYATFGFQDRHPARPLDQEHGINSMTSGLPSPEEHSTDPNYQPDQYLKVVDTGYPSSALPYFHSRAIMEEHGAVNDVKLVDTIEEDQAEQVTSALPHDGSTEENSFKSPPPPANIATRRNIPRPATLQVATSRSRSYNLGPKTGIEGLRRADPTSPATAMRRIASAGGNMAGRIQKQSAGPRSPLFLNRNTEAFLQYHSRSPVSVFSAAFANATPPTPMTPAVMSQGGREPTVSSTCSDDEAFMLGHGIESLKTPPETPGVLGGISTTLNGHPFNAGMDFTADQPLLTPYFQTEFPDLSLRHIPSYVDMSDGSLPSTPLYPSIMGTAAQDPNSLASAVVGNTQYDWDANESITSTKSSPGQLRPRQIQFTPNITPQDYSFVQER